MVSPSMILSNLGKKQPFYGLQKTTKTTFSAVTQKRGGGALAMPLPSPAHFWKTKGGGSSPLSLMLATPLHNMAAKIYKFDKTIQT